MFRYFTDEESREMTFWHELEAGSGGRQPL
jgi:hypothetical protein